jgi:hypothetical protein
MPCHQLKWRRRALFSSVYSCISGQTCLLRYNWLWFPRECDGTRGVKRPITTALGFQVSTVSWWSTHSCLAFILHWLRYQQPRKVFWEEQVSATRKSCTIYLNASDSIHVVHIYANIFVHKETFTIIRCTRDSLSTTNLTGPDTSHSWQLRNGCFVPRFGEPNMYQQW